MPVRSLTVAARTRVFESRTVEPGASDPLAAGPLPADSPAPGPPVPASASTFDTFANLLEMLLPVATETAPDADGSKRTLAPHAVPVVNPQVSPPLPFRFRFALPIKTAADRDQAKSGDGTLPMALPMALAAEPETSPPADAPAKPAEPAGFALIEPPLIEPTLIQPTVRAEAGALPLGDLAFAAKLTPQAPAETAPPTAPVKAPQPAHREPSSRESAREAPTAQPIAAPGGAPNAPRVNGVFAAPHAASDPPREAAQQKSEIRETPRLPETPPEPVGAKPLEGLRDISLKLTDAKQEQIEVRLLERAGELRVSVRSADTQLNTELRSGLGDLAGKLEKSGYHTETWQPAGERARATETAQTGSSKQEQDPRQDQRQNPERRQPRQEPADVRNLRTARPAWVEEMNRDFPTGDTSR